MFIKNVLIVICSISFLMIGADKFFLFLEPPCSLMNDIPDGIWKGLGVLQLLAGILIWVPSFRKYITAFFTVFMIVFSIVHLTQHTYDIGGSVFMSILLGILAWNPRFINHKKA